MPKSDILDTLQQALNVGQQVVNQKKTHSHTKDQLTRREQLGVLMAQQSYKEPGKRQYKVKNYKYQPEFSSDKFAVYKSKKGRYQVAVRGTVPTHGLGESSGDLGQDIEIMKGKFNQNSAQVVETQDVINKILATDSKARGNIGLNGHSLGGRIVLEALHDPRNEGVFRDSVALAPGFSPLGDQAEQTRQEKLVTGKKNRNFVVGVANDVVWSGNKAMHKGHSNVKILKAEDTRLTHAHKNHFLTAFTAGGLTKEEDFRPPNYWHRQVKKNPKNF